MRCINCNSEIEDSANFCRYCGTKVTSISNDKEIKDNSLEERCMKAYVGENKYDKFSGSFNVFAFFLGPIYLLYRKMYLYTFLYFVIICVVSVLGIFANLILAFVVNSLYLSKVKTDVRNIISTNKGKSDDEIIDICIKKGGTSFIAVIIYLAVSFAVIALIGWGIYELYKYDQRDSLENNYNNEDNELKYDVPSGFNKTSENSYISFNDNHRCYIYISKSYKGTYQSESEYIESRYYNKEMEKKTINGNTWYFYIDSYNLAEDKVSNFINISGNDIFMVKYHIYKDDDKYCSNSLDEFSSSLKVVDKSGALA